VGSTFKVAVNIEAPPQRVFAVLHDVERWPEWTSTMISVQRLDQGPFAIGSSARVHQPNLRPAVWQVTELDDGRCFTWVTSAPGLRMKAVHKIEPRDSGSRVELSFELSGLISPLLSRLYGRMIERYIATESEGLKQRSEAAT
jgi:uncharacterized membrane protein